MFRPFLGKGIRAVLDLLLLGPWDLALKGARFQSSTRYLVFGRKVKRGEKEKRKKKKREENRGKGTNNLTTYSPKPKDRRI